MNADRIARARAIAQESEDGALILELCRLLENQEALTNYWQSEAA